MGTIEMLVDRLKELSASRQEVLDSLEHDAALVRVNALEAVARMAQDDESLIPAIAQAAMNECNNVRLLGTTTVRHVALGCLLCIANDSARRAAADIIEKWPADDRTDLQWYLDSEGISLAAGDCGQ
jgi:hypothetical protein